MNIKILQAAVDYSLDQAKTNGIKIADCNQQHCQSNTAVKKADVDCMNCKHNTDIADLKQAADYLERVAIQQQINTSWQSLNQLDYSLQQLYKHAEQNSDDCLQFLLELNGKLLLLDFNPAAFSDLQRLIHRQIAVSYADNIE